MEARLRTTERESKIDRQRERGREESPLFAVWQWLRNRTKQEISLVAVSKVQNSDGRFLSHFNKEVNTVRLQRHIFVGNLLKVHFQLI